MPKITLPRLVKRRFRVRLRRAYQSAYRKLDAAYYWLKCWLFHRYNVVVCRALPITWCDRDYLMLFATFQILEDFVDREQGHFYENVFVTYTEAGFDKERVRQEESDWDALRNLYVWWIVRKADKYSDDYDEDNDMLKRLIDLRKYLWT